MINPLLGRSPNPVNPIAYPQPISRLSPSPGWGGQPPRAILPPRVPIQGPQPVGPAPRMPILGQFKKGGIVPKTGAYKLHRGETVTPAGGKMTAAKRRSLPASKFALSKGHYPMDTKGRARAALSRISEFGSPAQVSKVRRRVHEAWPSMKMKSVSALKA